jgi:hypothetical protein
VGDDPCICNSDCASGQKCGIHDFSTLKLTDDDEKILRQDFIDNTGQEIPCKVLKKVVDY